MSDQQQEQHQLNTNTFQVGERVTIITRSTILVCTVSAIRPNHQIEVTSDKLHGREGAPGKPARARAAGPEAEPIPITG